MAGEFDSSWYLKFQEHGNWEAFDQLGGERDVRDAQKEAFLRGEIENPTLDYPYLAEFPFDDYEAGLLKLKAAIISQEEVEAVREAYRWKINEKLAELRMLRAAQQGDIRRFKHYSHFVYGGPSKEVFDFTVNKLHEEIAQLDILDLRVYNVAASLRDSLPLPTETSITLPDERLFKRIQQMVQSELKELASEPLTEESYAADDVKKVLDRVLEKIGAEGWSTEISRNRDNMSISQSKQKVQTSERPQKGVRLKKLIEHEIGKHVRRRLHGEESPLQLLGLGLDRYERGEEGVATLAEQGLDQRFTDYTHLDAFMGIALAKGVDGTPRNFREVFTILEKIYAIKYFNEDMPYEKAMKQARNDAWDRCVRTFRGTDCKTRGACLTKDIIYREGNIWVWNTIDDRPSELDRLNMGKYDMANDRHMWVLSQLGLVKERFERPAK